MHVAVRLRRCRQLNISIFNKAHRCFFTVTFRFQTSPLYIFLRYKAMCHTKSPKLRVILLLLSWNDHKKCNLHIDESIYWPEHSNLLKKMRSSQFLRKTNLVIDRFDKNVNLQQRFGLLFIWNENSNPELLLTIFKFIGFKIYSLIGKSLIFRNNKTISFQSSWNEKTVTNIILSSKF